MKRMHFQTILIFVLENGTRRNRPCGKFSIFIALNTCVMRNFITLCLCMAALCCSQNLVSAQDIQPEEVFSQKDSLMIGLAEEIYYADSLRTVIQYRQNLTGRYEIYKTDNQNVHLRLDTATGEVYMVYYEISDDWNKRLYKVCGPVWGREDPPYIKGRFKLHPTINMYNFVLLDTISGACWGIQWSYDENKRFRSSQIY